MIAAAALGIRLSVAGGWRRSVFVALVSSIGAYLLAGALELPGAVLVPGEVGERQRAVPLATTLAVVVVPATLLLLAVNRLSAQLRDARLARLRMLGLSARRVRIVAAAENAVFGAAGAVVGVLLYALTAPASGRWLIDRGGFLVTTFPARPWHLVAVVTGVVLLSCVVAMAPHRTITGNGLAARVEGARPMPSPWRLLPLLAGLGLSAYVLTSDWPTDRGVPSRILAAFLAGTVLTGAGIIIALAPLIAWSVALLARLALPVPALLAVRRQQAEPTSVVRLLTGLVLATFLTAFAMGPIAVFEGTVQYAAASRIADEGPQMSIVNGGGLTEKGAAAELAAIPGVLAVWGLADGSGLSCRTSSAATPCALLIVAECATVTTILGGSSCSPDRPTWVSPVDGQVPVVSVTGAARTLPVRTARPRVGTATAWQVGSWVLALTPEQSRRLGLDVVPAVQVWTDASGRSDAPLAAWSRDHGATMFAGWRIEYSELERFRFLVHAVGAVVIGLGLLVVLISAVDRVIERRRVVASLVAVGAPRRTLVLAQLTQALIGIVPAVALAVGCGIACAAAYLHFGQVYQAHIPWASLSAVAVVALGGGVVVALATTAGVGARLTPEALRRE